MTCDNCDSTGWVCEHHADKPWGGVSNRSDACECGPGMPCNHCDIGHQDVARSLVLTKWGLEQSALNTELPRKVK
jgi:hypothetical protein